MASSICLVSRHQYKLVSAWRRSALACVVCVAAAWASNALAVNVFELTYSAPINGSLICKSNNITAIDSNAPPGCQAGLVKCQGWGDPNFLPDGSAVQCVATPASNYVLRGWGDDCSAAGSSPTCAFTMNSAKKVSALFAPIVLTGSGSTAGGQVTLDIAGAGCVLDGAPAYAPAPASGAPAGYTFPFGQIGFTATACNGGGTLNVTLTLPSAPANAVLLKLVDGQWKPWAATFNGSSVQYAVTDNDGSSSAQATGDNNPAAGNIDDPVLVAVPIPVVVPPVQPPVEPPVPPPVATPVPALSTWAIALLTLLAGIWGAMRMGRRWLGR